MELKRGWGNQQLLGGFPEVSDEFSMATCWGSWKEMYMDS